jgi:uncharacterized repeat protein (TIGR01451 family)
MIISAARACIGTPKAFGSRLLGSGLFRCVLAAMLLAWSAGASATSSAEVSMINQLTGNTDTHGTVSVGDTLTFTVTMSNIGGVTLNNVVISDPLITPNTITCPSVNSVSQCILTGTYTVTTADATAGSITNTATVTANEIPLSQTAPTVIAVNTPSTTAAYVEIKQTGNTDPDLSSNVSVGDVLTYKVLIGNESSVALTNVTVSDPLITPNTATCPSVPANGSCSLTGTYTVNSSDASAGNIDNTASVTSTEIPGPITVFVNTKVFTNGVASMSVSKSLDFKNGNPTGTIQPVIAGDILTYVVDMRNTGTMPLTNVVVSDPRLSPNSITCPTVSVSAFCTLTGTHTVSNADATAGSISNTASASSTEVPGPINSNTVVTPVVATGGSAVMNVRTTQTGFADNDSSGNVTLGDRLDYSITATNTGTVPLTNVQVNDDFSAVHTCASVAVNATCVQTSSHLVTAADVTGGQVVNEGRAFSNETNDVSNTVITRVFGDQMTVYVELNFDNSNGQQPTAGDVFHYSVIVTNQNSTGSLTNVHVGDLTLSPSTTTTCATLAAGATCVLNGDYTVTPADVTAGHVTNTGTASSDQVPGPLSYSVTQSVFPASGFVNVRTTNALTSNADNDHSGTVTVGDVLTYTSTATNTGTIAASNVQLSSTLLTPSSVTCASVAPNASCVLTGTHTVTNADAASGQIVFSPDETDGSGSNNNGAPVVTPVATAGGAAMSVFVDINNVVDVDHSGTTTAGDTAQIIVTALNSGSTPLTNVQVSDTQTTPSTTTCASVATGATCVLNGTYTILASDISSSAKIIFTGSATSTQVPGPVSFTRDVKIDGNTIDTVSLLPVAGNMQSGAPGSTLPIPLKVRLLDFTGTAIPGVPIQFVIISSSNAHVTSALVNTDSLGEASTQLVLPSTPGTVTVVACPGPNKDCAPSTSFTAFATGAVVVPPALTIVSGNNQTLTVNTTSAPLVVQLMNNGLPVQNATITWSGNNATPTNATSLTDANGRATNTATVHAAGAASVSASSTTPAAGPVTFALNGGLATLTGLTPQQIQVAGALDNACPALSALETLTPAQQDLLNQCEALSAATAQNPDQVRKALDAMLPHNALLQTNAGIQVATAQFDNIKARIAALRSGSGGTHFGGLSFSTPDGTLPIGRIGDAALGFTNAASNDKQKQEVGSDFDRWGFFASGTFGQGSSDPRQVTPGYGFHTNGITAGVDYRFNDHMIFGVSAGYAKYSSNVDTVGGGLDTHGWSLSAYSTFYRQDSWYADGVLSWGSNTYDINRRIIYTLTTGTGTTSVNQTATSSSGGNTLAGALTLGRDFAKGPLSFGPYLRGTYTHTNFDGYQESLLSSLSGSGLGLAVSSRSVNSVASVIGAKVNYASSQSWGVLMPHAEVEWEHEFENNPDSITARFLQDPTATPIQINGDSVDTNFFRLGLGMSFVLPKGRSGFIYYEKTLGLSGITQNNLTLGFRMEF